METIRAHIQDDHTSSRRGNNLIEITPTSDAPRSDSAYEETRDAFILGFNVTREVSEATELLSPLKSTCLLLVRGLEITRVRIAYAQYYPYSIIENRI